VGCPDIKAFTHGNGPTEASSGDGAQGAIETEIGKTDGAATEAGCRTYR
jgi:hypothetical protein